MHNVLSLNRALFAAAIVALMLAAVAILLVMERRERLQARIRATVAPYQRLSAPAAGVGTGVALNQVSQGIGRRVARLFGFDPATSERYLLAWWLAIPAALLCAFAIERVVALLIGQVTLLAVLPLWLKLSRSFFKWCDHRWQQKLFAQFPDALAMIVRAVRVGIPVSDAIRAVGAEQPAPTGPVFTRIADEIRIGTPLDEALQSLAEHTGLQEYRFFATALTLQNQTGGGLSETLDNLAETIRKRVAVRLRGAALAAEAKTSAAVLAALPVLAAGGLMVISPDYIRVLFTDPSGKHILASAVASMMSGIGMMRYMIRKSLG